MWVTESLTESLTESCFSDSTDVTLVSEDTDDYDDESYLGMKVI